MKGAESGARSAPVEGPTREWFLAAVPCCQRARRAFCSLISTGLVLPGGHLSLLLICALQAARGLLSLCTLEM